MKFFRLLSLGTAMCVLTVGGCSEMSSGTELVEPTVGTQGDTPDNSGRSDAPPAFLDAPTSTAALRSVLAGYSIQFDSAKLTEQCKVDNSGASIDDIEVVANAYGLLAEQRLFPVDDLCTGDGVRLPSIVIAVRDGGDREFVNVWRRRGNRVQIMDPWVGVSWVDCTEFQRRVYIHEMEVSGITHRGLVAVVISGRAGFAGPARP